MVSINKSVVAGYLGKDPEVRTFPNGDRVANVRIATTDKWKDKESGELREATEWHTVVFTGRLAGVAADYLRKGSAVYVEGSLRTRKYSDKEGVDRYVTEIRASELQLLDKRPADGGGSWAGSPPDDDVPY